MMKRLFYRILWVWCKIGVNLYFNRIEVNGFENLPKDGAIIYAPNHQNAFLDAIIIAVLSREPVSFFTRADVFRPPFLWLLDALNMLPILRRKDGFSKAAQNEQIFAASVNLLLEGKPLMIFPEAYHGYPYFLRTLSKGTARVALQAQMKSDRPIYIVPVGLNFFRRHRPRFKLIVNYGKAINIQNFLAYYKEHKGRTLTAVRDKMTKELKYQMVIPENDEQYDQRIKVFTRSHERLIFKKLRERATELDFEKDEAYFFLKLFLGFLTIVNYPPIFMAGYVLKFIKDPVFGGSIKFAVAIFLVPVWYLACFLVLKLFFTLWLAFLGALSLVLSLFLRQELVRYVD